MSRPVAILLASLMSSLLAPGALASGNHAAVHLEGEGNAVSVCQVLVLVNGVIVMGLEDGLGLAALPRGDASDVVATVLPPAAGAGRSSCASHIGELRLEGMGERLAPTYVGGPSSLAAAAGPSAARAAGQDSVAICQHLVLVSAVILGGSAYGLDAGYHPPVVTLRVGGAEGQASCGAGVGSVHVA